VNTIGRITAMNEKAMLRPGPSQLRRYLAEGWQVRDPNTETPKGWESLLLVSPPLMLIRGPRY
jgi:hypothetical protein